MAESMWPMEVCPASQAWRIIDPVGENVSPFTGKISTVQRSGTKWGCTIVTQRIVDQSKRRRLINALAMLRGRGNTIWVPDYAHALAGSFPATELLTNGRFDDGTNGWTGAGANVGALSVADRIMRVPWAANDGSSEANAYQVAAATQYAPHCGRVFLSRKTYASGTAGIYLASTNIGASAQATGGALLTARVNPVLTTITHYLNGLASNAIAGDYCEYSYSSLSRCISVDNGPNSFLYSDQRDNPAWTKGNCTVAANAHTSPDGTVTSDSIIESDATDVEHYLQQTITVTAGTQDIAYVETVAAITRGWCVIRMTEATGSSHAYVFVNLSTGATGATFAGTNWSNVRAFVTDLGSGWYRIALIARKTNAATSIYCTINSSTGDTVFHYAGSAATDAITVWRGGAYPSSVPFSPGQTTSAATTGTSQTGSTINVKGLPPSVNGLLEIDDPFSLGIQRNIAVGRLNSDAAGLGTIQLAMPFRTAPADNDPICVNTPLSKMKLAGDPIEWNTGYGRGTQFQIELEEDVE